MNVVRAAGLLASVAALCAGAACGGEAAGKSSDAGMTTLPIAGSGSGGKSGGSGGSAAIERDAAVAGAGGAGSGGAGSGGAARDAATGMANGHDDAATAIDAAAPGNACDLCAAYAAPMQTGSVEPAELSALSGLAVSRTQPEIVFTHNDHDRPLVYALDLQGRIHARIALDAAPATDIEDIAVGPCGAVTCVYLGDIGDNAATRDEYALLRFTEPRVPDEPGSTSMSVVFERYRFTYEDGSHNAEGLMVSADGTIYIVTKRAPGSGGRVAADGPSSIYRLRQPLSTTEVAVASLVATLPIPAGDDLAASAAAAHPCDLGFLVRTYDRVYEFRTPAGADFEAAFGVAPKVVAMPDEPQSEGIDYRADGRGFVTSGEGAGAPLVLTACE